MPANERLPCQEAFHGDVVRGDERGGGTGTGQAGRASHGQGREARLVGRLEGHVARAHGRPGGAPDRVGRWG